MPAATADIGAVVAEVVELAQAVEGLRCYAYAPSAGELHPPLLAVMDVEPRYNETMGAGMTGLSMRLVLNVGGVVNRAVQESLRAFLDNTGDRSVRQALEDRGPYTNFDDLAVVGFQAVGFDEIAELGFYGGIFAVDIII
jgi:hypothetical protein